MKRLIIYVVLPCLIIAATVLPVLALRQGSAVSAEAVGQANLRSTTDANSTLLGQIVSGTRYPVLARSEFYPWVLLGDPATNRPIGWVYVDLVTITGDVNQVPLSTQEVGSGPATLTLMPTASKTAVQQASAEPTLYGVALPTQEPATPSSSVTGLVQGEINVRYGPGVEFPRLGVAEAGDRFAVVAWYTNAPWVEIRYDASPNGLAWVATDLLTFEGADPHSLPSVSQTRFDLPTLTPTQPVIEASRLLGGTEVPPSPEFLALGNQVWNMMLQAQFDPATSRLGAFFLMDMKTGQAITFGQNIAFSGMSVNKIAVLTDLYRLLSGPPSDGEAIDIAEAMVCSQNISTNRLLRDISNSSPFQGAQMVTQFLQQLGLTRTFIATPFGEDPSITPEPTNPITTSADQTAAEPDPYNQLTVDEMGTLLASIYQCANNNDGLLIAKFGDAFTPEKCQQMIDIMSTNHIYNLIESGVPEGTRVAHKHGWIPDTHGDAGIVFTPGGDYVLVMVVHNPIWIDYSESFPLMDEISRTIYNYYNPNAQLAEVHSQPLSEDCNVVGNPIVSEILTGHF
jgi:uncharacterized protein YraI